MLIEICSTDNGSGMSTKLKAYKCYNPQQKLFESTPCCTIEEDDFCSLLTDKQVEQFINGKYIFNIKLNDLLELQC